MDSITRFRLAEEQFDKVVAAVAAEQWDTPSACAAWTVRDVAGHVTWGRRQLRAWATGEPDEQTAGAPGSPHPGVLTGDDPGAAWQAARDSAAPVLTPETLGRLTTLPGLGEVPVAAVVDLLTMDTAVHAWDIAHGIGAPLTLPVELVEFSDAWARRNVRRAPGFFGPEVTPTADADAQTRLLAFVGRSA